MKKTILITFLIFLAISLQVVKVVYSNLFTTSGIDLNAITLKEETLKTENIALRDQLYKNTAYTQIEKEAIKKGFAYNPNATTFVGNASSIALR